MENGKLRVDNVGQFLPDGKNILKLLHFYFIYDIIIMLHEFYIFKLLVFSFGKNAGSLNIQVSLKI